MLKTTLRLDRAMLIACLWTCSFNLFGCSNPTVCDYTESYDAVVTVSVEEPVHITKYKWCLDIPPRCPDHKQEFRTVRKNITVPKTRAIKKCCKDHVRLYDDCIPKCTENQCPNIQCSPDTDKCECKPGYIGHLCKQTCDVGHWGPGCGNLCHAACLDCDHRYGCCMTALLAGVGDARNHTTAAALKFCADSATASSSVARRLGDNPTGGPGSVPERGADVPAAATRVGIAENPVGTATPRPSARGGSESTGEKLFAVGVPPLQRRENGTPYVRAVTTMEVKVYKYDELVKKLIWISAMTVAAIAMVFAIMFVVFFNCYSVSRASDRTKNGRPSTLMASAELRVHETCFGTDKLGHITPDRYTKTPGLRTSTNNDLPLHPEIFCPVFSAPHYTIITKHRIPDTSPEPLLQDTGSSLYDSPQPLYEILC